MLGNIARCFMLLAAWTSLHAAQPNELVPVPIGGHGHYVLLPVTAPDFKPHRNLLANISTRLLGRMAPLLNEWNYQERLPKAESEIAIALVIDKSTGATGGARIMWGPFAGDSDVVAHVDLIERPSGKLLGRQAFFIVKKATLGTDSDYLMYDDLVNQVVAFLASCYALQPSATPISVPP